MKVSREALYNEKIMKVLLSVHVVLEPGFKPLWVPKVSPQEDAYSGGDTEVVYVAAITKSVRIKSLLHSKNTRLGRILEFPEGIQNL